MGDVSVMQGTLPLILEAPHGGRIWHGWPARVSGVMTSDQNTDLFTEEWWEDPVGHQVGCWCFLRGFWQRSYTMIVDVRKTPIVQ